MLLARILDRSAFRRPRHRPAQPPSCAAGTARTSAAAPPTPRRAGRGAGSLPPPARPDPAWPGRPSAASRCACYGPRFADRLPAAARNRPAIPAIAGVCAGRTGEDRTPPATAAAPHRSEQIAPDPPPRRPTGRTRPVPEFDRRAGSARPAATRSDRASHAAHPPVRADLAGAGQREGAPLVAGRAARIRQARRHPAAGPARTCRCGQRPRPRGCCARAAGFSSGKPAPPVTEADCGSGQAPGRVACARRRTCDGLVYPTRNRFMYLLSQTQPPPVTSATKPPRRGVLAPRPTAPTPRPRGWPRSACGSGSSRVARGRARRQRPPTPSAPGIADVTPPFTVKSRRRARRSPAPRHGPGAPRSRLRAPAGQRQRGPETQVVLQGQAPDASRRAAALCIRAGGAGAGIPGPPALSMAAFGTTAWS